MGSLQKSEWANSSPVPGSEGADNKTLVQQLCWENTPFNYYTTKNLSWLYIRDSKKLYTCIYIIFEKKNYW